MLPVAAEHVVNKDVKEGGRVLLLSEFEKEKFRTILAYQFQLDMPLQLR